MVFAQIRERARASLVDAGWREHLCCDRDSLHILDRRSGTQCRRVHYPSLVLQIISPAVLTYAQLNRRLLDIGFALNRAAVFTGVSLVVDGIFVLAEGAFSR